MDKDIVKFTVNPENADELIALIDEINAHAALSEEEKSQLMHEVAELRHQSPEDLL
ncbi:MULTISPECIES: hypothetical protein [Paenibacillus]|uniref:hypothetical protein n=1 Tax=Paenibacillus TaxID=44249 RepID=UPI0022B87CEB|nr:hypothetical protein [Paenibacillus caseinilyticus]MCZ8519968.1 hypothetical protein [Paenibacillus caseinilyticus]